MLHRKNKKLHFRQLVLPVIALVFFILSGTIRVSAQVVYPVSDTSITSIKVFLTMDTLMADLKVFRVYTVSESTQIGLWFEAISSNGGAKAIFWSDDINNSDLRILYVDSPDQVGWINDKSYLFQ